MIYSPKQLEEKINEKVAQLPLKNSPENLFSPIKYILAIGGKRIRPIFSLMAANLFQDNIENVYDVAVGIEIFHNFSLVHDDLMDNSDLRRGKATVHKKWNKNIAILSGDAMLIEAYKSIALAPTQHLGKILPLFSRTAMAVCEGQQLDMDFETRIEVENTDYIEMIRLKTAELLACSLKMGAILGEAQSDDANFIYQFGINIGIAFQLKDDLLDVYGDTKKFGKKIGGDIVNNKKTWLLINALKRANKEQKKQLMYWLQAEKFDPTCKIEAVKKIYDELGLQRAAEKLIEKYYLEGMDCLSRISTSDERKSQLLAYTENLMYREK